MSWLLTDLGEPSILWVATLLWVVLGCRQKLAIHKALREPISSIPSWFLLEFLLWLPWMDYDLTCKSNQPFHPVSSFCSRCFHSNRMKPGHSALLGSAVSSCSCSAWSSLGCLMIGFHLWIFFVSYPSCFETYEGLWYWFFNHILCSTSVVSFQYEKLFLLFLKTVIFC